MSSVTQTPGTTLRLRVRDSGGTDRDLTFPFPTQPRNWFSRIDPFLIKTHIMDDFSQPTAFAWTMQDVFGGSGNDLTKRGGFLRLVESPWYGNMTGKVLQIYGGDTTNAPITVDTKQNVPYIGTKKIGAEIIFGYLPEMVDEGAFISLVVEQFDETNEIRGQIRYRPNVGTLEYEDSAAVYQNITTVTGDKALWGMKNSMWNYLQLETDWTKTPAVYTEVQLNHSTFTLSNPTLFSQADVSAKKSGLELHIWNTTGTIIEGAEFFVRFLHLYERL